MDELDYLVQPVAMHLRAPILYIVWAYNTLPSPVIEKLLLLMDVKSIQENSLFLKPMVPNDQAQVVSSSSPYGVFMFKSFQESPIHSYMVHVPFNSVLLITCLIQN